MSDQRVRLLFEPQSIAIVGASSDPAKASGLPLRNVLQSRFSGKIYPVNPRATEISGVRCYPSVTDLPEAPDVAVLMVDARLSPQVLEECGRKGVKAAVVGSAGFSESGPEGQERQAQLSAIAKQYDIRVCGPNCHARLMECIKERVSDGRVLELIEAYLHQDIVKDMEQWRPSGGTPQGAVISPLLANIYLHGLDGQMVQKGYRMVRYADDFVVLCRSSEDAQAALAEVRAWVEVNGLSLNAEKTHVGDCRQWGQGFDFLGYHFEVRRRWVRRKSLKAMHDRIRMRTKRTRGDSLAKIIVELNPTLRGWFNYFKQAHPNTFIWMDSFVRRRLRAILRKQEKRPGMGVCREDHQRWPNTFFAAQGLFIMHTAWKLASQSR